MLLHVNLVLLCVCGTIAVSFDLTQIKELIDRSLNCLEKTPLLNENATYQVARVMGYSEALYHTVPNLQPETSAYLTSLISRLMPFINNGLEAYPNSLRRYTWLSAYWSIRIDFAFEAGRLVKRPRLRNTFYEILKGSIPTPDVVSCSTDLFVDNPQSDDLRVCDARCQAMMEDASLDIPPEPRASYFAGEIVNNCSNFSPMGYRDKLAYLCGFMKPEIDVLLKYRHRPQFKDALFYFMNKIVYCAAGGITEVFSDEVVSTVVEGIDCNGCVGVTRGDYDKQVLTAETLVVLVNVYRLIIETEESSQ